LEYRFAEKSEFGNGIALPTNTRTLETRFL
jgi:hypothetical protein